MNDDDEVEALINGAQTHIRSWATHMRRAHYSEAGMLAIKAIRHYHTIKFIAPSERYSYSMYGVKALLNGLRDISNICIITAHNGWIDHPIAVEEVWKLSQDASARLIGSVGLSDDFITFCNGFLRPALKAIKLRFGDGLYTSWEMVFDYYECTICASDIRGCNHIPNRWYFGRRCKVKPVGGEMSHIALVEHPRDKRCRIWPWMKQDSPSGGATFKVPVYITFDPEGDENGGSMIDPASLSLVTRIPRDGMTATVNITDPERFRARL